MSSTSFVQFLTVSCFNLAFGRNWIAIDLSLSYPGKCLTSRGFILLNEAWCMSLVNGII